MIAGTVNSFTVTGTHTYAEEGTYAVKATVTDTDIPTVHATANSTARVADAPLRSTGLTNGRLAVQGAPVLLWPGSGNAVLAHFTDDDPQGTPSDYTAVVDWGDGTQSPAVVTEGPAGGFDVTGNHVYASQQLGVHTVVIDVTDAGGSATQATTTVLAYGYSSGGTFAIGYESPGRPPGLRGPGCVLVARLELGELPERRHPVYYRIRGVRHQPARQSGAARDSTERYLVYRGDRPIRPPPGQCSQQTRWSW